MIWKRLGYKLLWEPFPAKISHRLFETRWPRPPLFSPSWLIQWSMGEGSYITLFSPSDVTAFHRMKYGGGGSHITLFSPSDDTAFHRMKYGGGVLYNLVFTEWRHCVSRKRNWQVLLFATDVNICTLGYERVTHYMDTKNRVQNPFCEPY